MGRFKKTAVEKLIAEGTADVVSATRLSADHPLVKVPKVVPSGVPLPQAAPFSCHMVCFSKPPTVNNLFLSAGRKRVKTPEYRQWIEDNRQEAARLRKPSVFPVVMNYRLCGKFRRSADGANYEKPVVDLLVSEGVIPDDNLQYVTGGRWDYMASDADPVILVWWEPIQE